MYASKNRKEKFWGTGEYMFPGRQSGNELQAAGPATEKAQWNNIERRRRSTNSHLFIMKGRSTMAKIYGKNAIMVTYTMNSHLVKTNLFNFFVLSWGAKYCDEQYAGLCLSTNISPQNRHQKFYKIFCACCWGHGSVLLWGQLYVMYFQFCTWRYVCHN